MSIEIETAKKSDVDELLKLYFLIYGATYPLTFGTDRDVCAKTIESPQHRWLVARDTEKNAVVGSVVFELDRLNKIGKVEGLVIHPDYRKHSLGHRLVEKGTNDLISDNGPLNSIYTTTRTTTVGPQLVFIRNGYLPLGIFPNAHKLEHYETLTLFVKFRKGALENRSTIEAVPEKLLPILSLLKKNLGIDYKLKASDPQGVERHAPLKFEIVDAPCYVERRFNERFTDIYDRFYPFHIPNLILASTTNDVEIYAYLSRKDKYCTIVALTVPFFELAGSMSNILDTLREAGASYVETMLGLQHIRSIEALVDAQFLPSAVYPACQEIGGKLIDFVIMSRSMEPLNFKGMEIDKSFKPFIDQYVDLWKTMHLETLEVFHESRKHFSSR